MKILHLNIIVLIITSGITLTLGARMRCPTVVLSNGSAQTKSKGRIIQFKCNRGFKMLGEPYAACIRGRWDPDPPACLKPGCIPIRNFKNGHITESKRSALLEFSCNTGYKLVGPSFIYCNGRRWNTMQPYCKAADITCDFESGTTCSWSVDIDDEFTWHVQQHESPSRILGTGPKTDHTSANASGHYYLMIETSDYGSGTQLLPARIHSPKFPPPSSNDTCFIFWYHMFGTTVGMLNVFLNNVVVFQEKNNHGDRWIKGVVPLTQNGTDLQIIIEGTYGGEHTGDIGLDDFSVGNGTDCIYSKVTSCEGICNKNPAETATCLCSPECFVDSSCCEDYDEFCSAGSTTSASLVTESYQTELSGSSESIETEENSTTETTIMSFGSTETFHNSDTSTSPFEEYTSLEHSTEINSELPDMFSSSLSQEDELRTHRNESLTEKYSKVNNTLPHLHLTAIREETQAFTQTSTTPFTSVFSNFTPSFPINETHRIKSTTLKLLTTGSVETDARKTPYVQTTLTTQLTVSTALGNTIKANSSQKTTSPNSRTTTKLTTRNYFPQTTAKPFLFTMYVTLPASRFFTQSRTVPPHSIPNKTTVARQIPPYLSPGTRKPKTATTNHHLYTYSARATQNILTTSKRRTEPTTRKPLLKLATLAMGVKNLTNALHTVTKATTLKPSTTELKIIAKPSTITPRNKLQQITSYKHSNKPVTHLEKEKTTVANIRTTELLKTEKLTDKNEPLQVETSTIEAQLRDHGNPKVDVKFHPLITPKEKLLLTPKEVDDSTTAMKEVIISGICVIIILAGGILIGVFIVKRRRLRFVNDSEGDVLYTSSEEMLDLHLARPIQLYDK